MVAIQTTKASKSGIATAARGQTGKQKAAAAKAGATAKPAESGKEGEKKKKLGAPALPVPVIKAGAMSKDVGPRVALGMADMAKQEADANRVLAGLESKRYDLMTQLTQAIVKAANADKQIKLEAAFSGDTKQMNELNNALGIALGFREVKVIGDVERVVTADALQDIWPRQGETAKNSELYQRKATVRSNFLHALKKCVQAAEGIRAKGLKMQADKATGTLRLSGPEIKSTFGADSVLLNEKQTVGEGDKAIKLKAKPSFTSIANMGAIAHGKVMKTRVQSGVGHAGSSGVDPVTAFVSVCKTLVQAIAKLGDKPDAKQVEALASVQNAIDSWGGLPASE